MRPRCAARAGARTASSCSRPRPPLPSANSAPIYAAPGHLVFTRNEALLAQRFDAGRRRLIGDPVRIGDPPAGSFYTASPGASVSITGVLAWLSAGKPNTKLK